MMNRIREKEVWARVMAASAEAPAAEAAKPVPKQPPQTAQTGLSEAQVLALMQAEANSAHTYAALAGRVRSGSRAALEQLAREERGHQQQLAAMYYLMTGQKAHVGNAQTPRAAGMAEALRTQYQAHTGAADHYRSLAGSAGPFASAFRSLGSDEDRHAQTVLKLLPGLL